MKLYHAIAAGLLLFVAVGCTAVHSPAAATNTGTGQTVINQE